MLQVISFIDSNYYYRGI